MNHAFVVDASVALKWVLDEEFTDKARALFSDSRRVRRPLYCPPNLLNEVANALYQRLRRRTITSDEAEQALQDFFSWPPVQVVSLPGLYQGAFEFARDNRLPDIYDGLYVVLAQRLNAILWTDDRRLLNAVRIVAPWVRWIGDYQPSGADENNERS